MTIDVTQIIIAGIGLIFTAVIIPLIKAAFEWLKGKTQNEAIKAALEEAKTVADQVVASLQATVVDGLKAKSTDGKLSAEDVAEIADSAVEMFLSDISERSLELLENNADDITSYIGNLIESRLAQLKKS
jgi:prolyl oligopeptidase PreP (S9A serine peptidase family)